MTKVAIYCRVDHGSASYGQFAIEQQKRQLEQFEKTMVCALQTVTAIAHITALI